MAETFSSSDGRSVIAADTGDDLGKIKGFVIDAGANRVTAVHISGRGKRAEIVPWERVRSFGADAVMVDQADAPEQVTTAHDIEAVKGHIVLRGSRVLNTEGVEMGEVTDAMFDVDTGLLSGVLTEAGRIGADGFRSLGSYALVVDASVGEPGR